MPASTERQREMMAIAEHNPSKLYARNRGVLKMPTSSLREFAMGIGKKKKRKVR